MSFDELTSTFIKDPQRNMGSVAVILLVSALYLCTIRPGQPWGDDFAMYIHEAKNIIEGTPFLITGYIFNPSQPEVGPRLYPLVFPVLLVPGYAIGGLSDFTPMKIEVIGLFIGLLVLLWRGLGQELPGPLCTAMLAIIGFNPLFWNFKEIIVSDIPFTFLLYVTFILADKLVSDAENTSGGRWQIAAVAALVYFCYGTRTIGGVLVPALAILAAIYWKRGGQRLGWAVAIALVPCFIQYILLARYLNYGDQLRLSPATEIRVILDNVSTYSWHLATFWANPYAKWLRDLLFVAATLLASLAYFRRLRDRPRIYEIFLPLYLGVVILYPYSGGFRYLIPVAPLYIFYALEGVDALSHLLKHRARIAVLVVLAALTAGSYGAEFGRAQFGAFHESADSKESAELFSFIRSYTAPNDVFVFQKPRTLALFTGRNASVYPAARTRADFCRYFRVIGATYMIKAPALDDKPLDDLIDRDFSKEGASFSNAAFRVMHIGSNALETCTEDTWMGSAPSVPSP